MGSMGGVETPELPDEPGDLTLVMWWKGLGRMTWRRVVECDGLVGGFWQS